MSGSTWVIGRRNVPCIIVNARNLESHPRYQSDFIAHGSRVPGRNTVYQQSLQGLHLAMYLRPQNSNHRVGIDEMFPALILIFDACQHATFTNA